MRAGRPFRRQPQHAWPQRRQDATRFGHRVRRGVEAVQEGDHRVEGLCAPVANAEAQQEAFREFGIDGVIRRRHFRRGIVEDVENARGDDDALGRSQ